MQMPPVSIWIFYNFVRVLCALVICGVIIVRCLTHSVCTGKDIARGLVLALSNGMRMFGYDFRRAQRDGRDLDHLVSNPGISDLAVKHGGDLRLQIFLFTLFTRVFSMISLPREVHHRNKDLRDVGRKHRYPFS